MSTRIPPGFAEMALQWDLPADPEPMMCFVGLDLAAGTGASQAVADTILETAHLALDNITSDDYTLGPGWVTFGQDGGDIRIDGSAAPIVGTVVGTAYPPQITILAKKLTASGGRRGRGRCYMPGVNSGVANNAGKITPAQITTFTSAWELMRTNVTALGDVDGLVLLHESAPFTPTPITEFVVDDRLATQRRRLRP